MKFLRMDEAGFQELVMVYVAVGDALYLEAGYTVFGRGEAGGDAEVPCYREIL